MKIVVSIPEKVLEELDRLARRMKMPGSRLFSEAVIEYLARHAPEGVTERIDRAIAAVCAQPDRFVAASARRVLEHTDW